MGVPYTGTEASAPRDIITNDDARLSGGGGTPGPDPAAFMRYDGTLLEWKPTTGNQWDLFLNDNYLTSLNNPEYTPTASGQYRVNTILNGSSVGSPSDPFQVDIGVSTNTYVDPSGGLNSKQSLGFIAISGRLYCYSDNRWNSLMDDLYGFGYHQQTEYSGTGTNPTMEWEHQGIPLEAGDRVRDIVVMGRGNNNEIQDIEYYICVLQPTAALGYQVGVSGDSQVEVAASVRDFFKDNSFFDNNLYGGPITRRYMARFRLDFTATRACELRIYARPVGTLTATRYFYHTARIELLRRFENAP